MLICGEGGGVSGGVEVEGFSQADEWLVGRQGWRWRGNVVQIEQRGTKIRRSGRMAGRQNGPDGRSGAGRKDGLGKVRGNQGRPVALGQPSAYRHHLLCPGYLRG